MYWGTSIQYVSKDIYLLNFTLTFFLFHFIFLSLYSLYFFFSVVSSVIFYFSIVFHLFAKRHIIHTTPAQSQGTFSIDIIVTICTFITWYTKDITSFLSFQKRILKLLTSVCVCVHVRHGVNICREGLIVSYTRDTNTRIKWL